MYTLEGMCMYIKERAMIVYICVSSCMWLQSTNSLHIHRQNWQACQFTYGFNLYTSRKTPTLLIPGCPFSPKRKKRGRNEQKLKCKTSGPNHSLFLHDLSLLKSLYWLYIQFRVRSGRRKTALEKYLSLIQSPENPNFQFKKKKDFTSGPW